MRSKLLLIIIVGLPLVLLGCQGSQEETKDPEWIDTRLTPKSEVKPQEQKPAKAPATPQTVAVPQAPPAKEQVPEPLNDLDVSFITPDFFAAVVVYPQRAAASPTLAKFEDPQLQVELLGDWGYDPRALEQLIVLASLPVGDSRQPGAPWAAASIARFAEPVNVQELLAEIWKERLAEGVDVAEEALGGKTYYRAGGAAAYFPDERTMVLAPEALLAKMVLAGEPASPLINRLRRVDLSGEMIAVLELETEAARRLAQQVAAQYREEVLPPQLGEFATIPDHLKAATLTVHLSAETPVRVVLEGNDARSASQLDNLARSAHFLAVQMLMTLAQGGSEELTETPVYQLAARVVENVRVSKQSGRVLITLARPKGIEDLLPQALTEVIETARAQAAMIVRVEKLRRVSVAMRTYCLTNGAFPAAASRDKEGKPLLSWRVHLLPFLGESDLYAQFHLDEPWDSPHNAELLKRIPQAYRSEDVAQEGSARYLVFVGEGTPFGGPKGPSPAALHGIASGRIMIIEAGVDKAVPWTKPEDVTLDPENPTPALGEAPPGAFLAAFFDGEIRPIPADIPGEILRELVQGREVAPSKLGPLVPQPPGTQPPVPPETQPPVQQETQPSTEPDTQPPVPPETQPPVQPKTQPPAQPETQPPAESEREPP